MIITISRECGSGGRELGKRAKYRDFYTTAKWGSMAKFLEFMLENQNYAISVENVHSVSQLHKIVRVPLSPNFVLGVTDYKRQKGIKQGVIIACLFVVQIYINECFGI